MPARWLVSAVGWFASGRPVPVEVVRAIRSLGGVPDALMPSSHPIDPSALANPVLAGNLRGVELGTWALGPASIQVLVDVVSRIHPGLVLEFGSGASTVALAWAIRGAGTADSRPALFSFEQDPAYAERTRELLARAGLQHVARVVTAPLVRRSIEGQWVSCYLLPADLSGVLDGRKADLVVIDGPAAEAGARFGTLPLVRDYMADGARFLLDDAMRDGELEVARRWSQLGYIRIQGIQVVEKGLLRGRIARP